jgi:hypothetical protein
MFFVKMAHEASSRDIIAHSSVSKAKVYSQSRNHGRAVGHYLVAAALGKSVGNELTYALGN